MKPVVLAMLLTGCVVGVAPALVPDRPVDVAADALYVRGTAVIRDAYCGGAVMTPEAKALLSRPAANLSLRLQPGRQMRDRQLRQEGGAHPEPPEDVDGIAATAATGTGGTGSVLPV